ncbi:MAG: class I SAM-dependent methyltransferase [Chloroflexi bacterium]|nr:class I SAM-dependent methyltransferase [Chloroflexota bacterium]
MSQSGLERDPDRSIGSNLSADVFAGTAEVYARYRPPYPDELLDDLRGRADITDKGRLLDLACGPGRVAIPLAEYFREVWAVDQEPEMIEVGQSRSKRKGLANIRWMVGRAEEIETAPGSFELITIGEAFHRLDQPVIAERAMAWLAPGRCLVTLGCFSLMVGREPWHDVLRAAVRRWTDRGAAGQATSARASPQTRGADHEGAVLTGHGFEHVGTFEFPHPYVWTLDSILGNLNSTSRLSRRVLGSEAERFDADVRRALLAFDSTGRYPETLRFGYSLFRAPEGRTSRDAPPKRTR